MTGNTPLKIEDPEYSKQDNEHQLLEIDCMHWHWLGLYHQVMIHRIGFSLRPMCFCSLAMEILYKLVLILCPFFYFDVRYKKPFTSNNRFPVFSI